MEYRNPLMVEIMIPRQPGVAERLHGFYEEIGWEHRNDTDSEFDTIVHPCVSEGMPPTIAYWQSERFKKIGQKIGPFAMHDVDIPSKYSKGLWLTKRQELVEVCLVVPSDDDVHTIFERGGKVLEAHSHVPLRRHAGRQEFRFTDAFNFAFRVTADVGWQIEPPK